MTWVAGVDGCRAGWIVVLTPLDDRARAEAQILPRFVDVIALPEAPLVIAVDIPIGLPERAGPGGRLADVEARTRLGARQSAVFAVPARSAVLATDYLAACALASAHSDPPRKVAKQTFNLFPKIREVDALMTPPLQDRVVECHPELAFWALNDERAVAEPKKVKSQPYAPGLALRRRLLQQTGFAAALLDGPGLRRTQAGADDLLDACACAWTAARIARGEARRFPEHPPLDAKGLRMEIWA